CNAAETSSADDAEALRALIQRQLPQIAQRLQWTTDKLNAPQKALIGDGKPAQEWWDNLRQRYAAEPVEFKAADITAGATVPAELFDSVADNLLQNALQKSKLEPGLRITVAFSAVTLSVCDNGVPLNEALAKALFIGPVASQNGLGIGLYQAARQATQTGYRLRLASNQIGRVCFELAPAN
ncbi:MAG: ATP-binding protein, partial [Burkholderiales bacterium]